MEPAKRNQTQLTAAIELCDGLETELLLCYNRKLQNQKPLLVSFFTNIV